MDHTKFNLADHWRLMSNLEALNGLAKKFDHDVMLVGFLPEHAFTNSVWEIGQKAFCNRHPLLKEGVQ